VKFLRTQWALAALAAACVCSSAHGAGSAPNAPAAPAETAQPELPKIATTPAALPNNAAPANRWEVRAADVTLSKTLERWAAAAGVKLKWDAARNFLIGAPDVYVGSFEGAVQHLLSSPGIRFSDFPLEACIYANTPPLIRITRQGEQTRECVAASAN
jgi:hypothetical protein